MSKRQRNQLRYYLKSIEEKFEEDKFEDFCEDFQFDKEGDREYFNIRFNDPFLKQMLDYDRTEDFFRDIDRQIVLISNIVFFIFGPRGEGKSEIFQKLMKYWIKRFLELKHKHVNKHNLINYVGFTDAQMVSIFKLMEEGDIAGKDEYPNPSGEGITTDKKNVQNIINQTRGLQTSLILVNPEPLEVSGVDYFIEVVGKDRSTKTTRCIWYDRRMREMGIIYFKLHKDKEFRQEYLEKKNLNMRTTLYRGGGVWSSYNQEQFAKDCINLYEFCIECNASSIADVKTLLNNYNLQFDTNKLEETKKIIGGPKRYIEDVIRNVIFAINGNYKALFKGFKEYINQTNPEELMDKQERDKILSQIQVEVSNEMKEDEFSLFLNQYYYKLLPERIKINQKTTIKKEIIIETLDMWASGIGIRDIGFQVDVHQGIVQDILILFKKGKRNQNTIRDDWRAYKMYEFWCGYKYDLIIISGHNKPDWKLELDLGTIFGECKIYDDIKNSKRIHKEKKLHSYNQLKDKYNYIPVLVRNVKWGNYDFLFKVPVNDDPYFTFVNDPDNIIDSLKDIDFNDIYRKDINYKEV